MIQRLFSMLLVVWLAASIAFFALRILPGDAIEAQLAIGGVSESQIDAQRESLGLNDPLPEQYARYMLGLLRGDMGNSLTNRLPVTELIFTRLHHTITLTALTMLVSILLAISIGLWAAQDNGWMPRLLINISLSMPIYWSATLAIILFAAELNWLPASGVGSVRNLILPVGVLSFNVMGGMAQIVQTNVRMVQQATFVQVAHSKGLTKRRIRLWHILRVGLIPLVTVAALQTGFLLSGTVITEQIFVRPGVGRLLLESTISQDYPVVQGIVVFSAVFYVLLNAIADVMHRLLDPRLGW